MAKWCTSITPPWWNTCAGLSWRPLTYLFPLDKVQAKSVVFVNTGHATQVKGHTRLVDPEQYKNKLCLGADVITL